MQGPEPEDLVAAITACVTTLEPAIGSDWARPAGDLAWDCRQTLDHLSNTLIFYATHLARRAATRVFHVRDGDPEATIEQLLDATRSSAMILAEVARAAPDDARAFHPARMADRTGFVAMGCDEVLIHTNDIATGLRVAFVPAPGSCRTVVRRLFPWTSDDADPWSCLLWANGRLALPNHDRLDQDWSWWCAPLAEWDDTTNRPTAPPL